MHDAALIRHNMQACGVVFPFAMPTSICRSTVTICSGLYLLIGMTRFSSKWILSHPTRYKNGRSRQGGWSAPSVPGSRAEYQHWAKLLDGIGLAIPICKTRLGHGAASRPLCNSKPFLRIMSKSAHLWCHDSAKIERSTPGESLPTTHLFCGVQSHSKRAQVYPRRGGKSQALDKFGWESAAWLNRSMRALVFS
jgi:hypothetical protein